MQQHHYHYQIWPAFLYEQTYWESKTCFECSYLSRLSLEPEMSVDLCPYFGFQCGQIRSKFLFPLPAGILDTAVHSSCSGWIQDAYCISRSSLLWLAWPLVRCWQAGCYPCWWRKPLGSHRLLWTGNERKFVWLFEGYEHAISWITAACLFLFLV